MEKKEIGVGTGEKEKNGREAKVRTGAKGGKSAKSNKTAHVLSLLTDRENEAKANSEPAAGKTAQAAAAEAFAAEIPPPSAAKPEDSEAVAEQIRSALEQALETESPDGQSSPEEAPQLAAAEAAEIASEPAADDAAKIAVQEGAENTAEEPADKAADGGLIPPAVVRPSPLSGISYVNVMQALVEEKVDKYIKLFGLCTCPRCKIDVMALALTNLPSKYVVMRENEAIPMLTVYENRYNAAIISQVMWACKKVMDHPRHNL